MAASREEAARGDFRNFGFDFGSGGFSAESGSIDPDILSELFGAGRTRGAQSVQRRGEDMGVSVTVPLATIAHGGSIRVALPTGKMLDVAVPAGIEEGKSIRLRGQGHAGHRGAPPGDVIVTIRYAPHPLFKVEGRDLRLDLPVTLYEAILGARVRAPTLSGEVEVSIAPGASGGRVLRLRGKGLPAGARSSRRRFVGDAADRPAERGGSGTERVDAQAARSKALRPPLGHGLNGLGRRVEQVVRDLQQ